MLKTALQENHLICSDKNQEALIHYLELMDKWNAVYNLTAITDPRDMIYLHLIDSLVIQPYLHGSRLLDVGTGAGLPGIPLAITNPNKHWTLLDKNNKKTRFLTQVVAELNLKNVEVIHGRCEDFHPTHCFDSILSRAYASISLFVESTKHLLCKDGLFIAMKGKYPQDELIELAKEIHLQKATRLDIKGIDVERHVICLSQQSS
jgi:16S rRNA (guanine527-N7)-methyltransferase